SPIVQNAQEEQSSASQNAPVSIPRTDGVLSCHPKERPCITQARERCRAFRQRGEHAKWPELTKVPSGTHETVQNLGGEQRQHGIWAPATAWSRRSGWARSDCGSSR